MATLILNHAKIKELMKRQNLRPVDIGRKLGISRQLAHYVVRTGGVKYSAKLAGILKCNERDLLIVSGVRMRIPKGLHMVGNRVRKG